MNIIRIAIILASTAFLAACSTVPTHDEQTRLVSPHYTATGPANSIRAWVYGDRTILDFGNEPITRTVKDENGAIVPYEKVGHFFRLARKLNVFTVRATTFRIVGPLPASITGGTITTPLLLQTIQTDRSYAPEHEAMTALLEAETQQLSKIRGVVANTAKLNRTQADMAATSSAMIMVFFDSYKSDFNPNPALAKVLVDAAKQARAIQVLGRTDSIVAGSLDEKIAKQRALSVEHYLVSRGVNAKKISSSWLGAGDAIAPANTDTGKAINRRVEIRFYSPRLASLRNARQ